MILLHLSKNLHQGVRVTPVMRKCRINGSIKTIHVQSSESLMPSLAPATTGTLILVMACMENPHAAAKGRWPGWVGTLAEFRFDTAMGAVDTAFLCRFAARSPACIGADRQPSASQRKRRQGAAP
jgi:hypothetical protein